MNIHDYASHGDCDGVRRELANGVSVDARDDKDFTRLACAAKSPNADESMLKLLIDAGTDLNVAIGPSHQTSVGLAAGVDNLQKSEFLMIAGANNPLK